MLNGLAVAGGVGYHYVRVTLDRKLVLPTPGPDPFRDSFLSGIFGGPSYGNNGFTVNLGFDDELLIEVRSSVSSPITVWWASYTLTPVLALTPSERLEEVQGIPHEFVEMRGRRVLIGPARWSRVLLAGDFWMPGDWIAGQVELRSEVEDEVPFEPVVPLVVRPPGRTRQFDPIAVLNDVQGSAGFEIPPGNLDDRRDLQYLLGTARNLEVVADLEGYANYPALLV